jgi:alpha-ketoglutarate-dependent taurine dioxygenase
MTTTAAGPQIVTAPALRADPGWPARERDRLRRLAAAHGAVLVRGLAVAAAADAAAVAAALADTLIEEREGFTPRVPRDGIYPAASWPSDQPMCMHHELSYGTAPPSLLIFCCLTAPGQGGATALADGAAVLGSLPGPLVDRFARVGWELRRSYNDTVGVPWPDAFGSADKATVERYCQLHRIGYHWQPDGGLVTRRTLPATRHHPVLGEQVWFNQIAFLNEQTMDPAVRDYLVAEFGPDGLPFSTRYGDGEPIEASVIELINEVYAVHTVREPWQDGDVLLVDNLRMAHSREPYEGDREVLVALADPAR